MTLLWQYRDIFLKKQSPATVTPASFTVSGNPVQLSSYRFAFQERTKLREIIQSMLDSNEIRPSNSPWSSPCLLTPKPSGGWRFVVDYRQLNKSIDRQFFPIPTIHETLQSLKGSTFFSSIDLLSGFHQLPLAEEVKQYTAFQSPFGLHEYNVLPQGLKVSPIIFQKTLQTIFQKVLYDFLLL